MSGVIVGHNRGHATLRHKLARVCDEFVHDAARSCVIHAGMFHVVQSQYLRSYNEATLSCSIVYVCSYCLQQR